MEDVLYNGSGGVTYTPTITLSGNIPATCGTRGVINSTYASNGIQNGSPDGVALVDSVGNVIEFLSYEGTFVATNGPAVGMVSRDIGVSEADTEPLGQSLRRNSAGTWFGPAANTFGACNDNTTPPDDSTVASVTELPASTTLVPGVTQQFTATAKNAFNVTLAGAFIGWNSTDLGVVTVDVNGVVKAIAPGVAQVIAVATNGKADTSAVTVNAAPPPSGLSNVRFSEIHYDNDGADINEAIEIEGRLAETSPAGKSFSTIRLAESSTIRKS